jgi:hypothetical protein
MAMYTFYLCTLGGGSSSFESFDLGSDAEAPGRALKMLAEHPSCTYVAVWNGDRPVLEHHREAVIFQAPNRPAVVAAPQRSL